MLHVPTCFKSSRPLPFGCLSLHQTSMKVKNTFLQRACQSHMYSSGMFWSKGSSRPKSSGSGCNIHESPTLKHQCGPYPHPEIPRPETFAPALSKSCICRVTFVQMKMCGSKSCSFPTNAAHKQSNRPTNQFWAAGQISHCKGPGEVQHSTLILNTHVARKQF